MAPTEIQTAYSGPHHKSVAALFGDDSDSQPLWFKKDAFGEPNFDTEAYISDLRRFVPFDTLRAELRSHQAVLKHELVELINRDYTDFVNLSTKLVDVDGAVLRMRMPLNELRGKLLTVRESVSGSLASLQDGLKRRAEASASREILELLLDTSHVVSKVEKLLVELQSMPEDDTHISDEPGKSDFQRDAKLGDEHVEHGANLEESRSRLLERIASEMNRLKFYVARAQDLPFIQNMERRIQNADFSLNASLRRSFEGGLERRDGSVIDHCLRAYAAIDNISGAEEAFRSAVVAPFVQQIIPTSPEKRVVGGNSDQLSEVLKEIETRIQTDCKFLLDISAAANSGLHVFDFLSNSILKEVHSAIQKGKPGAFSPGKPAEFLANYKASLKFLNFLEGYCQSQAAVEKFRSQSAYFEFMKQWNLGVYYTLRLQEIAGALDIAVTTTVTTPAQGVVNYDEDGSLGLALHPSSVLWDCLQRCWQEDVFIKAVSDKFLKLTLQLLSRYSTWLSAGLVARRAGNTEKPAGGNFALVATPEDFILVGHDVKLLAQKIKGPHLQHVEAALTPSAPEVFALVKQSIFQAADLLLELVPALTDVLTEALADKCAEALKQAKGITATFRMTNKPLPTRHSPYVSSILQPLKAFLEGERIIYLAQDAQEELLGTVVEKITTRYNDQARDIINTARKTESTLQRFRQGAARQRGGGADTSENSISDTDKICAQLFLDVQEYGRRLSALGISAADLPVYVSLWQCVATVDRQNDIRF
ncbi:conserved oligomeric Golgi complex subunit 2 [Marchantia polymorpha subsp. ruderalis]|uniref:Conserved oligomeric Golgi complex subunit 2 n=2 Tax=Marchantia polymorpha TaxID=3197 RepID=A0AAF6BY18_MARPO|nr:hypothetical protein MARPO_0003s0046 [Marchantia polymorpha]BBN16902.1 hypothetical protein Mp_7g10260 [Marchantia polymorpha subsp. ruderalis]|eukprot:PTQ49143.1 hypothetical protein MARPO_0003s0046 [Marchantia polymorpha]